MRQITFYLICVIIMFSTTLFAQVDFAFGVKPGIGLNGAYFGVNINGNVVPFIGFDYIGASGTLEESGVRYDYNLSQLIDYSDKDEASVSIYNLSIGGKFFFMNVQAIKSYFTGTFFKPFFSADYKQNGETETKVKDAVDNLNIWGLSFGFGTEYYFSDNFSVGGEFGMRLFMGTFKRTEKHNVYNPNTGTMLETDRNYNADLNLQLTYSVVSLNYYF